MMKPGKLHRAWQVFEADGVVREAGTFPTKISAQKYCDNMNRMLSQSIPDEPDYTDAADLEPSYYEESIARKTGVSVEQLRKEQEEADQFAAKKSRAIKRMIADFGPVKYTGDRRAK